MFSWLPRFAIVVALAGSIGLHWAIWQTVAWTSMVASYSRELSLTDAIAKTFDGQHPCQLCKQIEKGKSAEKKTDSTLDLRKFEFPYAPVAFLFHSPSAFWEVREAADSNRGLTRAPPVPPPRLLPA